MAEINDNVNAGFDHDDSGENGITKQAKDFLNSINPSLSGSLNDSLFAFLGDSSGYNDGDNVRTMNDRFKNYFSGGLTINDGMKNWEGVDPTADTTAPTYLTDPYLESRTDTTLTISFTPNESGLFDMVLLTDGTASPSASQLRAGDDGTGTDALQSVLNYPMQGGSSTEIVFSGLTENTNYDFYMIMEDDEETPNEQTTVFNLDLTTAEEDSEEEEETDEDAPVFVSGTPYVGFLTETSVSIWINFDEQCTVDMIVVGNGNTAPTTAQVQAGVNYTGGTVVSNDLDIAFTITPLLITLTGLTEDTSYDLYVVAEDNSGNKTATPEKLDFTTVEAPDEGEGLDDYYSMVFGGSGYEMRRGHWQGADMDIDSNGFTLSFWFKQLYAGNSYNWYPFGYGTKSYNAEGYSGAVDGNQAYIELVVDGRNSTNVKIQLRIATGGGNLIYATTNDINQTGWQNVWTNLFVSWDGTTSVPILKINDTAYAMSWVGTPVSTMPTPEVGHKRLIMSDAPNEFIQYWEQPVSAYFTQSSSQIFRIDQWAFWNGTPLDSSNATAIYNSGEPIDLTVNSGNYTRSSNLDVLLDFEDSSFVNHPSDLIDWEHTNKGVLGGLFYGAGDSSKLVEDSPSNPAEAYRRSQWGENTNTQAQGQAYQNAQASL